MTIFGLIKRDSGPDYHRIRIPLELMPRVDAYITNAIKPEDFTNRKPDAVYYNRIITNDVLRCAKDAGAKIVLDIDDWWILPPTHIAYRDYIANDFATIQRQHIKNADIVTTTHERLAEKISKFNKNVHVLPNAIPYHPYFNVQKTESEYTRVFWQGSITHEHDIDILRPVMKRLDKTKFAAVMAGYTPHPAWNRMVDSFTQGLKMKGCVLDGKPPHEYYQHYAHADICVCPLRDNDFNSLKSNLKILEAAHLGLPVIASHVHPYIGMPVMFANNLKEWELNITLCSNEDVAKRVGAELKQYCDKHYNFETINEKRKQLFYA